MKVRWTLFLIPMFLISLDAALIDEKDIESKILFKGCKGLRFNANPETYEYGIALGFVKGTVDAYREQLLHSGAKPKKKRSSTIAGMTRSACMVSIKDKSDDRFYDVFKQDVKLHIAQEFDGEVSISKKSKSTTPGIESFFEKY